MQSHTIVSLHPPLMTESEVAQFLSIDVGTLRAWRLRGGGPEYQKVGRLVRYNMSDVKSWLETRRRANTSQTKA